MYKLSTKQQSDIKKLKQMCEKKLNTMEYRTVTIKTVKNLSHSDVSTISDICSLLLKLGTTRLNQIISSEIKQVFAKINIEL